MLRDKIIKELSQLKTEKEEFFALKDFLKDSNHFLVDARIDIGKANRRIFDIISKKDFERVKTDADQLQEEIKKLELLEKSSGNEETINTLQSVIKDMENNLLEKINNLEQQSANNFSQNNQPLAVKESKIDIYEKIDTLYEDYLEYRKSYDNISHSSVKSYNASMKYFKYFITPETEFTFKFFKDVQKKFQQLPKNFFKYKKYYTISFEELMAIKEQENYETLDTKTINTHINNFKQFFDYLKYEEIIEDNPLDSIKQLIESKGTIKEEYSSEDLLQIFNSNWEQDYINMCKVALYAGLRIEEVLSLKKIDVKDNMIYIDIEDTGTKKHQRIVPIHSNLKSSIEHQIKHNSGEYLFFFGNVGNEVKNVGKRINRKLKKVIEAKEKSFHSFRKNFSQEIELNTNAEERTKKYLMGHSQSKDITHMIYNRGKVNTNKLIDCINQITFNY